MYGSPSSTLLVSPPTLHKHLGYGSVVLSNLHRVEAAGHDSRGKDGPHSRMCLICVSDAELSRAYDYGAELLRSRGSKLDLEYWRDSLQRLNEAQVVRKMNAHPLLSEVDYAIVNQEDLARLTQQLSSQ